MKGFTVLTDLREGRHMGGAPRKQTQPSRKGAESEYPWASVSTGVRYNPYTSKKHEGILLVYLNVTQSQGRVIRGTNYSRNQPMTPNGPSHLAGTHTLFMGMLSHQENLKFSTLTIHLA